ncbi:MAG: DUF642 domain-containing protein [Candidatus Cybelea sp.]
MHKIFMVFTTALALAACSTLGEPSAVPGGIARSATHNTRPATSAYCPANPSGTGILPDGDFSQAIVPNGDQLEKKGQKFAPDWTVKKRNIDFLSSSYWDMDGLCSVDIDGYFKTGSIETYAFTTQKKATYTVAFLMSGNGGCGPETKTLKVSANGHGTTFTWNTASGNDVQDGAYSPESWTFKAKKKATRLEFISKDPAGSSCGAVIAGIAVNEYSP